MVQKRGIMVALYGYYGYGYYYDPMYILIIISCVIALIAQVKVKSTFNKYSKVSYFLDYNYLSGFLILSE